ncbi:MAG TPA: hypothetical protein PLU95_13265 [Syntrophales bacterium]|nr:hypothetical protein [Syntrophales bacterium]HQK78746.1 hypothetical protein [Syntrophales bacterium]
MSAYTAPVELLFARASWGLDPRGIVDLFVSLTTPIPGWRLIA